MRNLKFNISSAPSNCRRQLQLVSALTTNDTLPSNADGHVANDNFSQMTLDDVAHDNLSLGAKTGY